MQPRSTLAATLILSSLALATLGCGATDATRSATPPTSAAVPGSTPPTSTATPGATPPSSGTTPGGTPPAAGGAPGTTPPPAAPPSAATSSFVYVANNGSDQHVGGSISAFRINPANGMLTPAVGPFIAGDGPSAIASDPKGQFVFVAEDQSAP